MPRIVGVTTALPSHVLTQEEVKSFAAKIFGESHTLRHLLPVFDHANIRKRHFVVDLEWFAKKHTFTEVNDRYIHASLDLCEIAIRKLADQCGMLTTDFDAIFFLSTTGLSTPSLDARLYNRIPMNPHIKRIPIWGLGCSAGASGIARAYDYLKAFPTHRALIVSVELCGLAFHPEDLSSENLVATALFGDGAAACLMIGDEVKLEPNTDTYPSVLGSRSTIFPDSLDVMSWRISTEGFKVQLSRDIPTIVKSLVRENVIEFLAEHSLTLRDLQHYLMHPGGMKVIQAYAEALEIPLEKLNHSIDVLREYGNMSSTTIFFILKRFLEQTRHRAQGHGLLSALGPGFSSELVLLAWN